MRRLCLLLCLLPSLCCAQPWSAEVKTGFWWNSKPTEPSTNERSSPIGSLLIVGASRSIGSFWEVGLSYGIYPIATRIVGPFIGQHPQRGLYTFEVDYKKRTPALGLKAQLRRHLDTGRLRTYVGIVPAYYHSGGYETYYDIRFPAGKQGSYCLGLELQYGLAYRITHHLSLLAEPSLGILNVPVYGGRGYMLTGSLSLGARFRVRR